ncbi:MAG TPA: translation elongation factor 4 [bacterium]|nr:translation elongation factor 4 [bacterium]HPS29017.1 translation elongation factor 4 [bacterium]
MKNIKNIRNFSIIAHIDHGKSTLADRLLEFTGSLSDREKKEQFLDDMELEKERGITIKARAVTVFHTYHGEVYELNFIDTPGHVDFSYEVSRALTSCEGALLVVDATQGVEAQTLANVYMAIDNNLEIIPVINKIDLPSADIEKAKSEIIEIIGIDATDALEVSAKTGVGIKALLDKIVTDIPCPKTDPAMKTRALIFDSWFDQYVGVRMLVRMFDGSIKTGEMIYLMHSKTEYEVIEICKYTPFLKKVDSIEAGEVAVISAGIKTIHDVKIGETMTKKTDMTSDVLPGFKPMKQMVYCGVFPIETSKYEDLKKAMEKLALNDSSFSYEPETSSALGFGFRCGFLGMLHLEIVKERLEREFDLELITTAPSVAYKVVLNNGTEMFVENPDKLPKLQMIDHIQEPFVKASIFTPAEFIGGLVKLCLDKRGRQKNLTYQTTDRVILEYDIPLSEIVYDFYDKLKSISRGFASLDYEFLDYEKSNLVKMDILINGDPVDALSVIVHKDKAYYMGRSLVMKMRRVIPRQMYDVAIQAAIGSTIISRETVKAYRKDVTAKCYGGDVSRKRKLLEKQKEGKKKMKQLGNVEIPQEAFLVVLDSTEE